MGIVGCEVSLETENCTAKMILDIAIAHCFHV